MLVLGESLHGVLCEWFILKVCFRQASSRDSRELVFVAASEFSQRLSFF